MKKAFKYFYLPVLTLASVLTIFTHGTPRLAHVTWLDVAIAVAVNACFLWLVWLLQRQSDLTDRVMGHLKVSVELGHQLAAQRDALIRRGYGQPPTPDEEQEAMDYFGQLGYQFPGKDGASQ